ERAIPDHVEYQVIPWRALGEILFPVVNDMVGTDRLDQLHLCGAAHASHLGAERFGDLHREQPDAAGRTVDQHPLAGLDCAWAAKRLERGTRRRGYGGSLVEGEVCRLEPELVCSSTCVLRKRAVADAENIVACLKPRHVLA